MRISDWSSDVCSSDLAERCKQADIVITTALIPGRPAPVLIAPETVAAMKPGSVIVDMAVERGGNCPLSVKDEIVRHEGVILVGISNLPALLPTDASALYARSSEERRVGKGCVSTCITRGLPYH